MLDHIQISQFYKISQFWPVYVKIYHRLFYISLLISEFLLETIYYPVKKLQFNKKTENMQLKKLVADLSLDKQMLQEVIAKKL